MEQRINNELRDRQVKNDYTKYSKETFDVIHSILLKRGENVSSSTKQVEITEEDNNSLTMRRFFSFQSMISSNLIQSFYILGAFTVTMISWILFMRNQLLIGILSIVVGNLFWRLACEIAVNFFRMNEQLELIHQQVRRTSND